MWESIHSQILGLLSVSIFQINSKILLNSVLLICNNYRVCKLSVGTSTKLYLYGFPQKLINFQRKIFVPAVNQSL